MSSSRPRSSSRPSSSRQKPNLQRKLKERTGSNGVLNQTDLSFDKRRSKSSRVYKTDDLVKKFLQRTFRNKFPLDLSFPQTSRKLQNTNFSHHDLELCVCDDCTCGRHLCKMHQVKPDLSKNSIYQKDFYKKCPVQNKINISKEYDKLQGPHLPMNSIYLKDYPGKKGDDLQRPTPEDLLKAGGPSPNLTSYTSGFPGYRCHNQYVKPTDKHTRGYFPLRGKSAYAKSFLGEQGKDGWNGGLKDNLKSGNNWFGQTTYGNKYQKPETQNYPEHVKIKQKLQINPDFKRQYETTYKNDFLGEKKQVCPAKTKLQTKIKGKYTNSKANFSENTDYKALSPEFHAISTSKHSYV